MPLIVAGTVRLPPENLDAARSVLAQMLAATHAEDGCVEFSYAEDIRDRGLIRVFEVWRDEAALDAHRSSEHIKTWREAWQAHGLHDRRLKAYEAADPKDI